VQSKINAGFLISSQNKDLLGIDEKEIVRHLDGKYCGQG
jgi:hypothetical protein